MTQVKKNTPEWWFRTYLPKEIADKAVANIDTSYRHYTDTFGSLSRAIGRSFDWEGSSEGDNYWANLFNEVLTGKYNEPQITIEFKSEKDSKAPKHYDNSNGSLYLFAEQQELNPWEFDILKRVIRCRKKGQFEEDLKKTIHVIELYLKEYKK